MSSPALVQTPAMQQYHRMKAEHPDALLFFRMGDFYELFFEDAVVAAKALEIALTSRSKDRDGNPVPMCGVPYHAASAYIARLVRQGFRVALCEQMEDPRTAKGVVKREVVRVITPGTQLEASALEAAETSYVMALEPGPDTLGVAWLEPTTGEFFAAEWDGAARFDRLRDEIGATRPREILARREADLPPWLSDPAQPEGAIPRAPVEDRAFEPERARRELLAHFGVATLEAFGCEGLPRATAAAGAALRYVRETQKRDLAHVTSLVTRGSQDVLALDSLTRRNLELVESLADGGRRGTLLDVLDHTRTAMGGRLLREWILRPLVELERIQDRLDAVEELAFRALDRGRLREAFGGVQDLDRILGRVTLGTAGPRDLVALGAVPAGAAGRGRGPRRVRRPAPAPAGEGARPAPRPGRRDRPHPGGRPSRARARGGLRPRRRRPRARRAAEHQPGRPRDDRRHRGARARAHRHRLAQGALQPGLRLLHRDQQVEPRPRPPRLRPQADDRGRRALRHPGAQGVRGQGPARGRADPRAGGAHLRGPARPPGRRRAARPADLAGGRRPRRAGLPRRGGDPVRLREAPARARRRARLRRGPPPGHGARPRRALRRQRPRHGRRRAAPVRPHRPEHGRQVDLPPPDGARRASWPRWAASSRRARPRSASWTASSPGSGRATRSCAGSPPSWSRCRRPPTSCATPPRAAWSSSTRSAGAPPPSTACRSPGRWPSTSRAPTRGRRRSSPPTTTSSWTSRPTCPSVGNLHVSAREWQDTVVFLRKIEPGGSDRSFGIQVARLAGLPAAVVVRAQEILRNLERTEFDREGRPRLAHSDEPAPARGAAALALLGPGRGGARRAAPGRPRPADPPPGAGPAGRAAQEAHALS